MVRSLYSRIRPLAWTGKRSKATLPTSTASKASMAVLAPACHAFPTARCSSSCTCSASCATSKTAARASASSSTVRRCLPAAQVPANRKSAATFSKPTCSKPSSRCPPTCSTTPALPPTSGCYPTRKPANAKAACSLSTASICAARCANRWAASATRWTSPTSPPSPVASVTLKSSMRANSTNRPSRRAIVVGNPPIPRAKHPRPSPARFSNRTSSATAASPSNARCVSPGSSATSASPACVSNPAR